jgi:hypothetical protein
LLTFRKAILTGAAAAPILLGQTPRGELLGHVTDGTGSVVIGAHVRAACPSAKAGAVTVTAAAGDYALRVPAPAECTLTVEMPGFRPYVLRKIDVPADEPVLVDVRIQVETSREMLDVAAAPPPLEAGPAGMNSIVKPEEFLELPIRNGSPFAMALMAPGVVNLSEGGTARAYENENLSAMAFHGAVPGTHEYSLDGFANNGGLSGNVAYVPPGAAVSEFRTGAARFDARDGFAMGSAIGFGLRSGGDRLHGELRFSPENPATDANSFFSNKSGSAKDDFRQNRWVAYLGGPLALPGHPAPRGRIYWMYATEGIVATQPYRRASLSYTVPSDLERAGNFSDLLALGSQYQVYDPYSTRPSSTAGRYTRTPYPGNVIPPARINQTASRILATYYPPANLKGVKPNAVNYLIPSTQQNRFQSHLVRLDRQFGAHDRLSFRASLSGRAQDAERTFNGGAGIVGQRDNRGFSLDNIFTPQPQLVLIARYSYTRYVNDYAPPSAGLDITALGFSQTYVNQVHAVDPRGLMLPDIAPTGYPELNGQQASRSASDIHSFALGASRSVGGHIFHFGGERRVYRDNAANTGRSSGKLLFDSNWTRGPLDNSAAAPIGQGLASFLLGLPTGGSMEVNPSLAQQYQVSALYGQDAWKAARNLTVSLGVRWEFEIPVTERYNRAVTSFDFDSPSPIASSAQTKYAQSPSAQLPAASFRVRGGVLFAGVNGQPRELWQSGKRNFAPRAALAWALGRAAVLRAGYGAFYDLARQSAIQTGFSRTTSLVASQDNGQSYIAGLENPFPNGFAMPTGSSLGLMTNAGQAASAFPRRLLNPYAQRWTVSVERSIGGKMAIEAGYVGSRGTRLRVTRQFNALPLSWLSPSLVRDNSRYSVLTTNLTNPFYPLLPGTNLSGTTVQLQQLLRPYPQFTGVASVGNQGFSWYHALQAVLQRRIPGGFLMASYAWSKYMEATAFLNEADPAPTHSISASDRTHRLVAAGVWALPLGKGKRLAARGVSKAILGGWQLHAIYQKQSGAPLSFGNVLYYGNGLRDIALPSGSRKPERWFNTSPFERASASQLVYNLRRFPLLLGGVRSMGLDLLDFGAARNLHVRERTTIQVRADAFNLTNRPHFAAPNTTPTSSDFGAVTTTSQLPRTIEFSARLLF